MKRVWLLGIVGFVSLACSGKVADSGTGAGTDRSSAEVLADEQGDLCTSICGKVESCGLDDDCVCEGDVCNCSGGSSEADCIDECGDIIAGAIESGESCADLTLQAMRCYDGLGCTELA